MPQAPQRGQGQMQGTEEPSSALGRDFQHTPGEAWCPISTYNVHGHLGVVKCSITWDGTFQPLGQAQGHQQQPQQHLGDARWNNVFPSAVFLLLNPQEFHTNCVPCLSLSLRKELLSLGVTPPVQRGVKSLPNSVPVADLDPPLPHGPKPTLCLLCFLIRTPSSSQHPSPGSWGWHWDPPTCWRPPPCPGLCCPVSP